MSRNGVWVTQNEKQWAERIKHDMKRLSKTVTEDPLGILWAGPETAKTIRLRAGADRRNQFGRMARFMALEQNEEQPYYVASFPGTEIPYFPVKPEFVDWIRERWEVAVRLSAGIGIHAGMEAAGFFLPRPGSTLEEVKEDAERRAREWEDENGAPAQESLDGRLTIKSIGEAAEEKLRWVRLFGGDNTGDLLWAASLMWVTDEFAKLVVAMADSLPEDYVPHEDDMGLLPHRALVMFDGDSITANLWHCVLKDGRLTVFPTMAGTISTATIQDSWEFGRAIGEASEYFRLFWAFALLVNEPLTWSRFERPDRATARRIARGGREPSDVLVITLRRPKVTESHEEAGARDWSCRWIVNPFWRNQWYPKEQRHKPKFIHAYVKGPNDKPLVIKNRAYRVSR